MHISYIGFSHNLTKELPERNNVLWCTDNLRTENKKATAILFCFVSYRILITSIEKSRYSLGDISLAEKLNLFI